MDGKHQVWAKTGAPNGHKILADGTHLVCDASQHAVLRIREAGLTVTDLGSTNGTSINGSDDRLNEGVEIPLIHGDRIHVGAWTTIRIERLQ